VRIPSAPDFDKPLPEPTISSSFVDHLPGLPSPLNGFEGPICRRGNVIVFSSATLEGELAWSSSTACVLTEIGPFRQFLLTALYWFSRHR
jgi:hypothetical protein